MMKLIKFASKLGVGTATIISALKKQFIDKLYSKNSILNANEEDFLNTKFKNDKLVKEKADKLKSRLEGKFNHIDFERKIYDGFEFTLFELEKFTSLIDEYFKVKSQIEMLDKEQGIYNNLSEYERYVLKSIKVKDIQELEKVFLDKSVFENEFFHFSGKMFKVKWLLNKSELDAVVSYTIVKYVNQEETNDGIIEPKRRQNNRADKKTNSGNHYYNDDDFAPDSYCSSCQTIPCQCSDPESTSTTWNF